MCTLDLIQKRYLVFLFKDILFRKSFLSVLALERVSASIVDCLILGCTWESLFNHICKLSYRTKQFGEIGLPLFKLVLGWILNYTFQVNFACKFGTTYIQNLLNYPYETSSSLSLLCWIEFPAYCLKRGCFRGSTRDCLNSHRLSFKWSKDGQDFRPFEPDATWLRLAEQPCV